MDNDWSFVRFAKILTRRALITEAMVAGVLYALEASLPSWPLMAVYLVLLVAGYFAWLTWRKRPEQRASEGGCLILLVGLLATCLLKVAYWVSLLAGTSVWFLEQASMLF